MDDASLTRIEGLMANVGWDLAAVDADPAKAAALWRRLDRLYSEVGALRAAAKAAVITNTTRGKHTMGELLVVRTRKINRSGWRNDVIAHRLMELDVPLNEALLSASVSYWKAGKRDDQEAPGLAWYGLDRDEFCDKEFAEDVQIVKAPQ